MPLAAVLVVTERVAALEPLVQPEKPPVSKSSPNKIPALAPAVALNAARPVKFVTVLLKTSRAVTVALKGWPAT